MEEHGLVKRVAEPLYRAKGWIQLAAVLSIIQGVLFILSIWGIVICWVPIWLGVLLFSAANEVKIACETEDEEALKKSLRKIALYFKILGILFLIAIIGGIVVAIVLPNIIAYRNRIMGQ